MSKSAHSALSQARSGATIVASSKAIMDDDKDPPCIGAKWEYQDIAQGVGGEFVCIGEDEDDLQVVTFEVSKTGMQQVAKLMSTFAYVKGGALGGQPLSHGSDE